MRRCVAGAPGIAFLAHRAFSMGVPQDRATPDVVDETQTKEAPGEKPLARVYEGTPLGEATASYYIRMPGSVKQKHMQMLHAGLGSYTNNSEIMVGSACSGSDIGVICLDNLLNTINQMMGPLARGGAEGSGMVGFAAAGLPFVCRHLFVGRRLTGRSSCDNAHALALGWTCASRTASSSRRWSRSGCSWRITSTRS